MIRLFLGIVSFLSVSVGGLWYGVSTDTPLDDAAFENEPITLEEVSAPVVASEAAEPIETPQAVTPIPESVPVPVSAPPESVAPEPEPAKVDPVPKTQETSRDGLAIQSRLLRFGYRVPTAGRSIDTVVLHSSYNASGGDAYDLEKTISQYETYGVGAHYIIDRKGVIYRLVEEGNIAYHAGASKMPDGRKNVNDFSIGIEMIATEDSGYTDKQYAAVNALVADIKSRHKIESIVGHGDIAPTRKTDPWKFDWKKLK